MTSVDMEELERMASRITDLFCISGAENGCTAAIKATLRDARGKALREAADTADAILNDGAASLVGNAIRALKSKEQP